MQRLQIMSDPPWHYIKVSCASKLQMQTDRLPVGGPHKVISYYYLERSYKSLGGHRLQKAPRL